MAKPLPPDYREFLRLLNERQVRYLLVGAHALALHGYPRNTEDLDIWLGIGEDNAQRVVQTLKDFGFGVADLSPEPFTKARQIVRLGRKPVLIELHTTITGVEFDACYARRLHAEIDGISVPALSLDDMKKAKASTGRVKDQADLRKLNEEE